MKKTMTLAVCIALPLFLAACSEGNPAAGTSPGGKSPADSDRSGTVGQSETSATGAAAPPPPIPAPDPNKMSTVVLSMYSYDRYFEDAKKAYEKLHPNISIDLRYAAKEFDPSGLLVEKFKTKTATEFLSGKGADMVVMDDLPADSFIAKRMLANLSAFMEGDAAFRKEDYFLNVLDNMKESDGNVYELPLSFYVSALLADSGDLERAGAKIDDAHWNWDQFAATAERLPMTGRYKYAYTEKQGSNFLYALVTSAYSRFVDPVKREARFDSDLFIGMLNQIKQLEKDNVVTFDFKNYEQVYFMQTDIYSFDDYLTRAEASKFKNPALYEAPKGEGQQSGGFFAPIANIAINANSSVKPEAWDFLKFMLSGQAGVTDKEPDGGLSAYSAFPVSKAAFEARKEAFAKDDRAKQEASRMLADYISEASNRKSTLPGEIEMLLWDETPAFFSGQKSAQAVADIIQNKATTYLNE